MGKWIIVIKCRRPHWRSAGSGWKGFCMILLLLRNWVRGRKSKLRRGMELLSRWMLSFKDYMTIKFITILLSKTNNLWKKWQETQDLDQKILSKTLRKNWNLGSQNHNTSSQWAKTRKNPTEFISWTNLTLKFWRTNSPTTLYKWNKIPNLQTSRQKSICMSISRFKKSHTPEVFLHLTTNNPEAFLQA